MNRFTLCLIFIIILALPAYSAGEGISEIAPASAEDLPVTGVTLFTAGLAQMVHETTVTDNQVINFQADPNDINDILKSLMVEDLDGGTVDVVNFSANDPLSAALGDLRVNPSGSPSLKSFLTRAQGEWVVVETKDGEFEGRILSIEEKSAAADGFNQSITILNLISSGGINTIDISKMTGLRFVDISLQNELMTALETISASRVKTVRTLKISFKGSGKRRVRLSYIRAVPLWKTSYRIIIDEKGSSRLEGWAIVQNTGSSAWENIRLSFIAGQPNAFTMDLATPKYITRRSAEIASQQPIGPTKYEKAYAAAPSMSRAYEADSFIEEAEAYTPPPVSSQATGERAGNFYRYEVKTPVTIEARSSAMIPIIQQSGTGSSLGVYDPAYDTVFKGIRLENESDAHWAAGPVTVLEGRSYGGDAILPDMIPGSSRLITYAVHGTLEVEKSLSTEPTRITALKITDGILYRTDKMRRETSYRVEGEEDELLIIHPKENGWKLTSSPEISEENSGEYRFSLDSWDKPVEIAEEYLISNQYSLLNFQLSDLSYYIEWDGISPEMKTAFSKISNLKRDVEKIKTEINNLNNRINQISRDQSRVRENMKVLDKESDLFIKYADQLAAQEEEMNSLNSNLNDARIRLQNANQELSDYIYKLEI